MSLELTDAAAIKQYVDDATEIIELEGIKNQAYVRHNFGQNMGQFIKLGDATNDLFKDFAKFYLLNSDKNGKSLRQRLNHLKDLIKDIERDILLTAMVRDEQGFIEVKAEYVIPLCQ